MIDNVKIEAAARAIFVYNSMNSWDDGDAHSAREHYRNLARAAFAAADAAGTIAPRQSPAEGHVSEWIEQCARIAEAQPYYPDTNVGMRQQWVKDQIAATIRALPSDKSSPAEGHDEPCFYCGLPCSTIAGDPSRWPLAFAQPDGTGIVRFHHVGCVVERLQSPAEMREREPISEHDLMALLNKHLYAERERLTNMSWKDGIDINKPTSGLVAFAAAIRALPTEETGK